MASARANCPWRRRAPSSTVEAMTRRTGDVTARMTTGISVEQLVDAMKVRAHLVECHRGHDGLRPLLDVADRATELEDAGIDRFEPRRGPSARRLG